MKTQNSKKTINIKMSEDEQQIIRDILTKLKLEFDEPTDKRRPRFRIFPCTECKSSNVYFNIPKNKKFVFQLVFENGNNDSTLTVAFANHLRSLYPPLPYPMGGGNGGYGYLTIYLSDKTMIPIINSNISIISSCITNEIDKVCKAEKTFKHP